MSTGTLIQITANDDSAETCDWALMLLRMYRMWAERNELSVDILDYQDGREAGIQSAMIILGGDGTYAMLRNETGIHTILHQSPFDACEKLNGASVIICSLTEQPVPTAFIRWGQNKSQGVVMTYDGITVRCNHSRDLSQNIQLGLKVLSALVAFRENHADDKLKGIRNINTLNPLSIESHYGVWNSNASELLTREVQRVLNGGIDEFLTHN